MRLEVLGQPSGPLQRIVFRQMEKRIGSVPGPIAVHSYRRKLYGRPFTKAIHDAMRRIKFWEVRDAELFGAFISKENRCTY